MNSYYFLLLILFWGGCSKSHSTETEIQGEWRKVTDYYPDFYSVGYANFSGDSVLFNSFNYQKFHIKKDTLVIELDKPLDHFIYGEVSEEQYAINYLSKDSLVVSEIVEYNWNGKDFKRDTVKHNFTRFVPIDNNPTLERIEFASGWCFGRCPQRDVTINSNGQMYYRPHKYDTIDRPYKSTEAKELFNKIALFVSTIPVDFLDKLNSYNADAQRIVVKFYFENGLEKQITTDHDTPLFPIFMKLEHSINFAQNLSPADTINLEVRNIVNDLPH